MESAMRKQLATKGLIDRFWENLVKVGKDKMTQSYLKTRLALLETYWERFVEGHYALLDFDDKEADNYVAGDCYSKTEEHYVAVKSRLASMTNDEAPAGGQEPASAAASVLKRIQLPKISLPTFSGDQLGWESFRDLFRSLVGDVSDLAPVQKLQYLKASLTHEAAAAVANIELNDKGFDTAWSELALRYDNRRVLLATHMRTFLTSAPVARPSPVELKRLSSSALQDLWKAGLSWDEPLPDPLQAAWSGFAVDLPGLELQRIPRYVGYRGPEGQAELHGFSDASNRAYAATIYLRCTTNEGAVSVHLLIAKTRVAPVKQVSIPRLELCGAVLLARLLRSTARALGLEDTRTFAWTDSTVALAWIRSHAARWKPFVAHRVSEIQDLVPPPQWRYVPSRENPADAATRGITPAALACLNLWWTGPPWLARAGYLLAEPGQAGDDTVTEELRPRAAFVARLEEENEILHRFSDMFRLLRATALCFRFAHNARHPRKYSGYLTAGEIAMSRERWVRIAQAHDFSQEIACLRNDRQLPARSPLLSLRPFLDQDGLLRVGGRLRQALLSFDEKHPIILAKKSHLSLLLVREAHANSLHGGPQLTRSLLLRRYWILQANSLVRSVIHGCVRCTRFRGVVANQQMGHLPAERTRPSRPFLFTGVDYAGPLAIRTTKGRGHKSIKGYICLFVCLSTRAVHLEAVSDLSSASFLAAFRRFTSRRGHCRRVLSDNGTNFQGAAKELRAMFRAASVFYSECAASLANDGTEWAFIPPGAPHFGGLWEAGVKAVKHHLRRVIGDARLTFEELTTLLAQIEACLNSRPLYALSNDPADLAALTPGHLLIGESLTAVPEAPTAVHGGGHMATRWSLTTAMRDHFWRRWSSEYVHHLQQLKRWRRTAPNVAVNDLVLIKSELQPPTDSSIPLTLERKAHLPL
ncbi:PREDICTED: uncharacterized protein LOC105557209 [Vollenhovia emeryi]|uniref:uncharacterized protein LOC105557209 n=1 Tax=Vollenhovia emeryi TaxID=411798 RepID=UPI0005F5178D|nr:PREDICTED: uncharacterized protein LOC105557209 [Vollenhovia emeryi]